jgi:hypothetical protein
MEPLGGGRKEGARGNPSFCLWSGYSASLICHLGKLHYYMLFFILLILNHSFVLPRSLSPIRPTDQVTESPHAVLPQPPPPPLSFPPALKLLSPPHFLAGLNLGLPPERSQQSEPSLLLFLLSFSLLRPTVSSVTNQSGLASLVGLCRLRLGRSR